jgi:hypothetical protein
VRIVVVVNVEVVVVIAAVSAQVMQSVSFPTPGLRSEGV